MVDINIAVLIICVILAKIVYILSIVDPPMENKTGRVIEFCAVIVLSVFIMWVGAYAKVDNIIKTEIKEISVTDDKTIQYAVVDDRIYNITYDRKRWYNDTFIVKIEYFGPRYWIKSASNDITVVERKHVE